MIERKQFEAFNVMEITFNSPKERIDFFSLPLYMQYDMDRRTNNFDPDTSKVGFIVTTEPEDIVFDGVLSKKGNVLAIYIPYANISSEVLDNPRVTSFEVCDSEIIKILQSTTSEVVELVNPCSGPVGDEWDSPSYNDFWGNVEQNFNRRIETLQRLGKKVRII
ncbi:MAG TPA: hypothetical protein PLU63_02310 [Candidatus Woesebacteria bacterium]|nr:hypothetical protein [Candidatus Woesebacteria bacterium]